MERKDFLPSLSPFFPMSDGKHRTSFSLSPFAHSNKRFELSWSEECSEKATHFMLLYKGEFRRVFYSSALFMTNNVAFV